MRPHGELAGKTLGVFVHAADDAADVRIAVAS